MNPWQMAQQLKHELQTVTWGTSSNTVFGCLLYTSDAADE